jgi:hypothetical protein
MLRGSASLLLCVAQRAPLARAALPLLAAFAPEAFRSLYVFARRPHADRVKVEVRDGADAGGLKKAVYVKLKLDAPPDGVRLLREVEGGGAPVPLDSRRALAEQGVFEGSSVIIEVLAALPPPLQAPLVFAAEDVGGTPMMVADLAASAPVPLPFFLALREHAALQRFLTARPAAARPLALSQPRILMLTGTIKSGKTRILHHVIPGMLSAGHAAAAGTPASRRRPVVFSHTFPLHRPAAECAEHLVGALLVFARAQGVHLPAPPGLPLNQFPQLAATLAARVHERGEELWLLLDELGAPIVASEPHSAIVFTLQLKDMLQQCWAAGGFMVGTGSGMASLLSAMRVAPPNGFALWDFVCHVRLGGTPTPAAALAMARRLHAHYSAAWPALGGGGEGLLAGAFSPERCVAELARGAHGDATSPRPALVAYLLELAQGVGAGSGADWAWRRVTDAVLRNLCQESAHDAAVALERLPAQGLRFLRHLADGRAVDVECRPGEHGGPKSSVLDVALLLCEDAEEGAAAAPVLLPPYGALVRSWITRGGLLAVCSAGGTQGLPPLTRSNLKALHTLAPRFPPSLSRAVSEAVQRVMLLNGIGTLVKAGGPALRAPRTVGEFAAVPAISSVLAALVAEAAQGGGKSPSVEKLTGLQRATRDAPAREYMQLFGLRALLLLRHMEAHVAFPAGVIVHAGFSCQVIVSAVNAALESVLSHEASAFELNHLGVLCAGAQLTESA